MSQQPVQPEVNDTTMSRLIAELSDESLPLKTRCQAARTLARLGSEAAMAALKSALAINSPPYLKAAIAEGLGECPNAEARPLLNDLVHENDEICARGAARGLALCGDPGAVNSLGSLLFDPKTPLSVRTEAALSLGDVKLLGAQSLLMRAMTEIQDESVVESVLTGMAKRPFAETQFFFNSYLGSGDVPVESKITAIEALGNAQADATPFLLNYINNPNAEIRAAVAWSLITADSASDISPQLMGALKQETDSTVRTRLYQALENQSATNSMVMLPLVQNESDPAARIAGFDFLAGTLQASPAPEVRTFFNQTAVPELKDTALNSDNSQARLASVLALNRAGTPEAIAALRTISQQSTDKKVISAVRLP
jgi:HEAT repeat protein